MRNFIAIFRKYTMAMVMNFAGLALAFTAFMALMLQVGYQRSFDRIHPTSGRIYRVDKVGAAKDDTFRNILPRGYADDIIGSSPHIEAASISCPFIGETVFYAYMGEGVEPLPFKMKQDIVYPALFDVFGVEMVEGSAQALEELSAVAIPESLARKLYGDESALGKVLLNDRIFGLNDETKNTQMTVGAVYRDFPANSQMSNCVYRNVGTAQQGQYGGANFSCWLLLDSPQSKSVVEDNFNANFNYQEDSEWLTDIELTPIEEIYFQDEGSAIYKNGSRRQMWLLVCISVLVMLVGGINYSNFFTALAPMRVKTINTQKVLGSSLYSLRRGLVMEAVVFCLCAFAVSLGCIGYVSQWLCSQGLLETQFVFGQQLSLVLFSAAIAVVVGLAAGIYPSFYVTSLPAAFALKGNFAFSLSGRRFRTVMMVLQYVVSFALLVFVLSVYRQNEYMMKYDHGFDKEQVLVVSLSQKHAVQKGEWLRERLGALPEVEDVAYSMDCVGGQDVYGINTMTLGGEDVRMFTIFCSYNFLSVMGIPVDEGRNFMEGDKYEGKAIMNHRLKELGAKIEDPVVGISAPVRINSMRNEAAPIMYIVLPDGDVAMNYAYIRLRSQFDKDAALEKIYAVLDEMAPGYLFEVKGYDEILGQLYKVEVKQGKIISIFSLLAAILSLVGVFGQVLLDVQYRRRDIAVRKVYGAETGGLVLGGLKRYFVLVAVAFAISCPMAWYAVAAWQENFVERVGLPLWIFAASFGVVLLLTLLIVAFQYWRAATVDPADTLQKE
ncbi:MAG: ABC transporter permease [Bacteroidales bacterium]|nr:ABC transporter permease [Bacteroidales bacterium]